MQGISIFQQIYAPRVAHVVTGFDGVSHNTHSPYAMGGVVGSVGKMTAIVANDQADTWHIVNLKCGKIFDAVAVLGAFDESEAANMAMRYHGQYFDAVCGDVCESNTGGLQRFLNHPVYMRTNRPVYAEELAKLQDIPSTQAILWDGVQLKSHNGSSKHLLLDMMRCDDDKALLEKMDFVEEESELDGEIAEYDALVVEAYKLESTVSKLALAMDKATSISTLKVANQTLSKPKTMRGFGVIQQLVSFELSDGQAVSIIFNVSDSEANASAKMTKDDLLVAWKYKLNSRDITAAVQPNATQNVSLNMIASRIMGLADANSEKFVAAQKKKDAMQTELANTNQRVKDLQGQEQSLIQEIADLQKQLDEKAKNNKALEAQKAEKEANKPKMPTGEELRQQGYNGVISALKANHDWKSSTVIDGVEKSFTGAGLEGFVNPNADLIVGFTHDSTYTMLKAISGNKPMGIVEYIPQYGLTAQTQENYDRIASQLNASVESTVEKMRASPALVEPVPVPTPAAKSTDLTEEEYAALKKAYDEFKAKTDKIGAAKSREDALKIATDLVTEMPKKEEQIRRAFSDAIRDNGWGRFEINFPKQPVKVNTDMELNRTLKRLQKALEDTDYSIYGVFKNKFAKLEFAYGKGITGKMHTASIEKRDDGFYNYDRTISNYRDEEYLKPLMDATVDWLNGKTIPKMMMGEDLRWYASGSTLSNSIDAAFKEAKAKAAPAAPVTQPNNTLQKDISKSELFKDANVWAIDDFGKENGMVIYSRDEQDGFSIGIVDKLKQVNMQYTDIDTDQQTNESFSTENITNEQVIEKIKMFIAKHEQKSVELLPVAQTGARYESPKELFLKKANKAYKDLEDNGLKGFAKRANDVVQDVASNIVSLEDAEKRLNGIIYESENPLVSGEWRDLGDRKVYFWEDMRYGEIVDTRKTEGRSKNVSNPWRTGDGKLFESLSVAKQHELETTSKYMFINDGYMQKTKSSETQQPVSEPPMTNPDRDYLQSIIDGALIPKESDMDTVIELAEKYENDEFITPLLEQALEVINQTQQAAVKGVV